MTRSAAVPSYRNLVVWTRAMDLTVSVYRLTALLPREETFGLRSQARRAAVSIAANIAEGKGRHSLPEYLRHLSIANGSLKELETHVLLMERLALVPSEELAKTLSSAEEIGRMLHGLRRALLRKCGQ